MSFFPFLSGLLSSFLSLKDSRREKKESLKADIFVEYCRASKGKNPGFLIINNGKHNAIDVKITARPALNFEPYMGYNHFSIPFLAPDSSVFVTYFPKRLTFVILIFTFKDGSGPKTIERTIYIKRSL